jgi:hypothetical protein
MTRRIVLALAAVLALGLMGACTAHWVHASGGWDCLQPFGQDNIETPVCPDDKPPQDLRAPSAG